MISGHALLVSAALCSATFAAPVHAGHATAEWITSRVSYEGGKPIQTGIRLIVEPGWHTYWINPGEAGSHFKVAWNLPEGWTASEVAFPAPKNIPGELPGYGYEGEVVLPVTVTPPAGAKGAIQLAAKVSWLTCDDDSCVPGKADLTLTLGSGDVQEGAVGAIEKALSQVPKPLEKARFFVRESGKTLALTLALPPGSGYDPVGSEVFPETSQAVNQNKVIRFQKTDSTWSASSEKSEYLEGPLKELKLVLVKKGQPPVYVSWKAQ